MFARGKRVVTGNRMATTVAAAVEFYPEFRPELTQKQVPIVGISVVHYQIVAVDGPEDDKVLSDDQPP